MKTLVQTGVLVRRRSLVLDWLVLVRPRMAAMVYLVALVGGLLAAAPLTDWARAFEAAVWITLVTACASILNQVLERDTDGLMDRTKDRPLVTGRIVPRDALFVGAACGAFGTLGLALSFNVLSALLALATLVIYVGIYTPMKRVSSLNTVIGAIPGAAPPLLGYVALAGRPEPWAWSLFAILFAWQFPHFMAIAWLYRADYRRAGMRMLPALPDSEGIAGRQAVLYAIALLPVSLLPFISGMAGFVYAFGAAGLGLAYLGASVRFALAENRARARTLLLVSLAYLPVLLALILLDPMVRTAIVS